MFFVFFFDLFCKKLRFFSIPQRKENLSLSLPYILKRAHLLDVGTKIGTSCLFATKSPLCFCLQICSRGFVFLFFIYLLFSLLCFLFDWSFSSFISFFSFSLVFFFPFLSPFPFDFYFEFLFFIYFSLINRLKRLGAVTSTVHLTYSLDMIDSCATYYDYRPTEVKSGFSLLFFFSFQILIFFISLSLTLSLTLSLSPHTQEPT